MTKIGVVFGTDTGYTRRIAKMIAKKLGDDVADKAVNVNRISLEEFLKYDALVLGTPTYAGGKLPGTSTGVAAGSWEEFVPKLKECDMSGKLVAIYGFGDQKKYSDRYVNAMRDLHDLVVGCGATVIGDWSTEGYSFESSRAVIDDRFLGLALDNANQGLLTEERVNTWLDQIAPRLLERTGLQSNAA